VAHLWSPDFDASCITAAIYGPTLADAAQACLVERAAKIERDAERAALLLLDASLAGLAGLAASLHARLAQIVRSDGDFFTVCAALDHLLYLYRYDAVLGTAGLVPVGGSSSSCSAAACGCSRARPPGRTGRGAAARRAAARRDIPALRRSRAARPRGARAVLRRAAADSGQLPAARGAAVGALWTLGATETDVVLATLHGFSQPDQLGDFLGGLFCLAASSRSGTPSSCAASTS